MIIDSDLLQYYFTQLLDLYEQFSFVGEEVSVHEWLKGLSRCGMKHWRLDLDDLTMSCSFNSCDESVVIFSSCFESLYEVSE